MPKVAGINSKGQVDPSKVVSKKLYDEALKATNELRKAAGKKPLKALPFGKPGDPTDCPLYNALSDIGIESVGGSDMEGVVKFKGKEGFAFDFGAHELIGLSDRVPSTVAVNTPFGKLEVEVEMVENPFDADYTPDVVQNLLDVADDFVSMFDDKGCEFLNKYDAESDE